MSESTPNSTSSSGARVSATSPTESESESPANATRKREPDKVPFTHSSNTSISRTLLEDSLKRPRFLLDYVSYLNSQLLHYKIQSTFNQKGITYFSRIFDSYMSIK